MAAVKSGVAAAAIFVVAFFYQFTKPSFPNDHFGHLSKAQLVLDGELPVRDFMDPGLPLTIAISAGLLSLSRGSLFAEALFTMGAISVGVVLVYRLSRRLTASVGLAIWAAACTLAIEPRLYNYPKVLTCTVAAWLACRYIDRPTRERAACLGAWTAVAFLFRHDLGLYAIVLAAVTFPLGVRGEGARRTMVLHGIIAGSVALAVVSPYLWFLATYGTPVGTVRDGLTALASAARVTLRPFALSAPADGTPWMRYNAEAWIYYLFLIAPAVAAGAMARRRRVATVSGRQAAAVAVLCAALMLFLIRGNLDSRLPDVAAPSFVLAAWVLTLLGRSRTSGTSARWARTAGAVSITGITMVAVAIVAEESPLTRLLRTAIRDLPHSVVAPAQRLLEPPLVAWEREGTTDVRGLARWLHECTAPGDRLLMFGYHPEVFFYSDRRFAGGMQFFHSGYFSSQAEQELTVTRLGRQRVPFVIVESEDLPALDNTYAIVGDYVRQNYRQVAASGFGEGRSFVIYQRKDVPRRSLRDGLPCLRSVVTKVPETQDLTYREVGRSSRQHGR